MLLPGEQPRLKNGRHSFLPEATSPSRACPALYPVVHPSVALPLSGPDQPGPGKYRGLRKGLTRCSADCFAAPTERRAALSYFEAKNVGRQGTSEAGTGAASDFQCPCLPHAWYHIHRLALLTLPYEVLLTPLPRLYFRCLHSSQHGNIVSIAQESGRPLSWSWRWSSRCPTWCRGTGQTTRKEWEGPSFLPSATSANCDAPEVFRLPLPFNSSTTATLCQQSRDAAAFSVFPTRSHS